MRTGLHGCREGHWGHHWFWWVLVLAITGRTFAAEISAPKFTVGPPASWVKPQFFDRSSGTGNLEPGAGMHWLLSAKQVNVAENETFYHRVRQILNVSAVAGQRADIIQQLAERGIDFPTVAAQAGKPDADPKRTKAQGQRINSKVNGPRTISAFSLQHSALPQVLRRQRADRLKQQHVAFFKFFAPEAREIPHGGRENEDRISKMNRIMANQSRKKSHPVNPVDPVHLPDVLKVRPISDHGNVAEIAKHFGGFEKLGEAVNQLQALLDA
jgi:hypothetical protein